MLTETLADNRKGLAAELGKNLSPKPTDASRIPLHPGALGYYKEHD
jgi:TRAP-type uncharacterized transport system substrate-binding protein